MKHHGNFAVILLVAAVSMMTFGASGGDLYVSPSGNDANDGLTGSTPVKTIQRAINLWATGVDAIRVAGGTYVENPALANNVRIYGGYNASTWNRDLVRSATILHPSEATSPVLSSIIVADKATGWLLDGMTLENGGSTTSSLDYSALGTVAQLAQVVGGGLFVTTGTGTVQNCAFQNNNAAFGGGAIALLGSSVTFQSCYFSSNRNYWGANEITTAVACGGGVAALNNSSTAVFEDCVLTSNSAAKYGGVIQVKQGSKARFSRCTISHNKGADGISYGGVSFGPGDMTFESCVLNHNKAVRAIISDFTAVANSGAEYKMINCTLYKNSALPYTGDPQGFLRLIMAAGTTSTVTNNIFESNGGPGIYYMLTYSGTGGRSWKNNLLPNDHITKNETSQTVPLFQAAYPTFATGNIAGSADLKCLGSGKQSDNLVSVAANNPAPGFTTLVGASRTFVVRGDTTAKAGDPYIVEDYDLGSSSAAIDKGTAVPASDIPLLDRAGAARQSPPGSPDIGAYEFPTGHTTARGAMVALQDLDQLDLLIVDDTGIPGLASVGMDWTEFR